MSELQSFMLLFMETKEQLQKMLTEPREPTLMKAASTIAARQKRNSRDPFSQHSDIRDITNAWSLTARYTATLM